MKVTILDGFPEGVLNRRVDIRTQRRWLVAEGRSRLFVIFAEVDRYAVAISSRPARLQRAIAPLTAAGTDGERRRHDAVNAPYALPSLVSCLINRIASQISPGSIFLHTLHGWLINFSAIGLVGAADGRKTILDHPKCDFINESGMVVKDRNHARFADDLSGRDGMIEQFASVESVL